jgi:hypothetical protein
MPLRKSKRIRLNGTNADVCYVIRRKYEYTKNFLLEASNDVALEMNTEETTYKSLLRQQNAEQSHNIR